MTGSIPGAEGLRKALTSTGNGYPVHARRGEWRTSAACIIRVPTVLYFDPRQPGQLDGVSGAIFDVATRLG